MNKERFSKVLAEAGVLNQEMVNALWESRPTNNLNERALENAAKRTKEQFPYALV